MKKAILIVAALILVVSGVAAVSAYEAHTINVKAHVENALTVDTTEVNFGTIFPEELMIAHRDIELSTSAVAELGTQEPGDLKSVTIQMYAEWKPVPANVTVVPVVLDADNNEYYAWLGDCLYVGFDATQDPLPLVGMTLVGPALAGPQSAQPILGTKVLGPNNIVSTQLAIAIDAPVFRGFYNEYTDVPVKQNGMDHPTWIIEEDDMYGRYLPDGVDLGIDLKIQVIDIARVK